MKILFQGVELSEKQVSVLRSIVSEAVGEFGGHPDHRAMVELHQMLLPVPMPFDPRPEVRVGVDGRLWTPIQLSAKPDENSEAWRRWEQAQRG